MHKSQQNKRRKGKLKKNKIENKLNNLIQNRSISVASVVIETNNF